jgi:hypothetical protein
MIDVYNGADYTTGRRDAWYVEDPLTHLAQPELDTHHRRQTIFLAGG